MRKMEKLVNTTDSEARLKLSVKRTMCYATGMLNAGWAGAERSAGLEKPLLCNRHAKRWLGWRERRAGRATQQLCNRHATH